MKIFHSAIDLYGNYYRLVQPNEFIRLEHSKQSKNDFYGYLNKNDEFIACSAHRDKQPKATFMVCDDKVYRESAYKK